MGITAQHHSYISVDVTMDICIPRFAQLVEISVNFDRTTHSHPPPHTHTPHPTHPHTPTPTPSLQSPASVLRLIITFVHFCPVLGNLLHEHADCVIAPKQCVSCVLITLSCALSLYVNYMANQSGNYATQ